MEYHSLADEGLVALVLAIYAIITVGLLLDED